MESWGTAEWISFVVVVMVQAGLFATFLVMIALTILNLQALSSGNTAGNSEAVGPS